MEHCVRPIFERAKMLGIILILLAVLSGIAFASYQWHIANTKPITSKDLIIHVENETNQYQIEIKTIRKEKGKEDIYVTNFMIDDQIEFTLDIPKSIFEKKIGLENNTYTMEYSVLHVYNKRPKFDPLDCVPDYICNDFQHYGVFDESKFTYGNSKELVAKTVKEMNEYINGNKDNDIHETNGNFDEESNVNWY